MGVAGVLWPEAKAQVAAMLSEPSMRKAAMQISVSPQ
jgi:hypothetical protein